MQKSKRKLKLNFFFDKISPLIDGKFGIYIFSVKITAYFIYNNVVVLTSFSPTHHAVLTC